MWIPLLNADTFSDCPSENTRNPYFLSEGKLVRTMSKFLLPKVIIFTGICLMVCFILAVVVRFSTSEDEGSKTFAAGFSSELQPKINNEEQKSYWSNNRPSETIVPQTTEVNTATEQQTRPETNIETTEETDVTSDEHISETSIATTDEIDTTSEQQNNSGSDIPTTEETLEDENVITMIEEQVKIAPNLKPRRPKVVLVLQSIPNVETTPQELDNSACGVDPKDFCSFTNDQSKMTEADAVVFRDIQSNKNPLTPMTRVNTKPSQIWILSVLQPYMPSWFKNYSSLFNLTANYDIQSDIPHFTHYYSTHMTTNSTLGQKLDTEEVKVAVYNANCKEEKMFFKKHGKTVQEFAQNNITIDFFRSNPHETCNISYTSSDQPKKDCEGLPMQNCYAHITKKYKFALAFEIYDADYISERFFMPLRCNIIPIVIYNRTSIKKHYESSSPKNSFVHFNNAQVSDVVHQLKYLNANSTKFREIFNWQSQGKIRTFKWGRWLCQVCGQIFKTLKSKQTAGFSRRKNLLYIDED